MKRKSPLPIWEGVVRVVDSYYGTRYPDFMLRTHAIEACILDWLSGRDVAIDYLKKHFHFQIR